MDKLHAYREYISASVLVLLAIGLWLYTGNFPQLEEGYPGPALFPRLIAWGLGISGLLLGIQAIRHQQPESSSTPVQPAGLWAWLRLAGGIGAIVLFPQLHQWMGFIPALAISCLCVALLMKVKPWLAVLTALGAATVIYLLFTQVLSVPL